MTPPAAAPNPPAQPVSAELSLYLDAVRFAAALTVFVAHFALHRLSGGFLWQLNTYGRQAVTVFFVLSGFVIAYAVDTRERDARSYALARAARIASVALPAVLLTALLDEIGSAIDAAAYAPDWGYVRDLSFWRFFSALTFTNEVWTLSVRQGSNAAYWSLGYEVPYYAIFGLALFVRGRWRWPAVAAALAFYGPAIAAAFPLWLSGVALYRWLRRGGVSERAGLMLFAGSIAAWLAYETFAWRWGRPLLPGNGWFKRHELLQDAVVAACFGANLLGFAAAAPMLGGWLRKWAAPVRWLAGATFTLYLCHLPIAQFLVACMPWDRSDPRSRVLVFAGTLLAVFVLAEFTERRKQAWRGALEYLWPAAAAAGQTRLTNR